MEQLAGVIGVALFFGLVYGLAEWLFRRLTDRLDSRLHAGWRWLTFPITAILCFAGFLVLRPLILDEPRTPLWFLIGAIAIALLISGATALAWAGIALGRWVVATLRNM